jgi:hypothetical protein
MLLSIPAPTNANAVIAPEVFSRSYSSEQRFPQPPEDFLFEGRGESWRPARR